MLQYLSPHRFLTGTEMGAAMGLSRAAIHKHIQALVERGVPIHRVPGRGYRLAENVTLLDGSLIAGFLSGSTRELVSEIEVLDEVDSTSACLAAGPSDRPLDGRVCLAETQTAGRGRRGRRWVASPYRDLMLSVGIEYSQWPAQLQTLGLVAALAVTRALNDLGLTGLLVKWPNDVIHGDHKLCGILLDVTGEAHGACRVIVGIGINVSMDRERGRGIDRQWTDFATIAGRAPDRNRLAAACLESLLPAFRSFPDRGFTPYRAEWGRLDALQGRAVAVIGSDGSVLNGQAAGVDDSGRLRVVDETGAVRVFTQGDVSIRIQ